MTIFESIKALNDLYDEFRSLDAGTCVSIEETELPRMTRAAGNVIKILADIKSEIEGNTEYSLTSTYSLNKLLTNVIAAQIRMNSFSTIYSSDAYLLSRLHDEL